MQGFLPGSLQAPDVPGEEGLSPHSPGVLQAHPQVGACTKGGGQSPQRGPTAPELAMGSFPPLGAAQLSAGDVLVPLER